MNADSWPELMERYRRALTAYALAGSTILGPVLPAHEGLHNHPETGSITAVERLLEHEGLHDHRETNLGTTRSIEISEYVVTGSGFWPGQLSSG